MKRLFGSAAMSLALALASGAVAPAVFPPSALAQENVSLEVFEAELAPYGEWFYHPRWGRVWAPNDMPQQWRPYTTGRWIWTDEHGWYWQADEEWGWIPFHYGRWAFDRRDGWIWVPGTVWGPAWVSWRETEDAYGWAPLPPEEEEEVVESDPVYWTFVAPQDFSAPRIYAVRLPPARVQVVFPRTRFVYRTTVRDRDNLPRGFNRGPDRVVVERRGNNRVDVRVVEPRFLDREIERRRGPNSAELQRFRERQREEGARIRVRVDEEGARRAGGPRGPDNAGGRQGDAPRRGNEDATPTGREQQQRQERQEQREQRQQRQERQEQRREQREERQQRREERQPEGRPDRRGPPPEAATGAEQPGGRRQQRPATEETPSRNQDAGRPGTPPEAEQQQNRRRRDDAPENAQPAQQQQQQQRQEPQQRQQRQEQQPQQQEQQRQQRQEQQPRQQRQEQRQEQQQQRQERQEQRQQRQEERQQRRNAPPANCTPGQPGC